MKLRKALALGLAAAMTVSMIGCGSTADTSTDTADTTEAAEETTEAADTTEESTESADATTDGVPGYLDINLDDYTDLTASIKFLHCRTDREEDGSMAEMIAKFNEKFPNIEVKTEGVTDYAEDALLRLSQGNWGDVMWIPAVDKKDLGSYFMPLGSTEEMSKSLNFVDSWSYDGISYGIPVWGNAQGVVYNKAVFEAAGITELPTTPTEFLEDLQLIKDNTDAIPLYTNYAAGWTMGAWDAYIGVVSNGDATYMNQKFVHTANPFDDPGDDTGIYNLYRILYDAVANGLIEDDYTTTDWEGCKGMINNGEIGCMVLGSWAVVQMQEAGDNADDIGYMPFPITVDGKQYASAGPDYCYGINVHSDYDNQLASMIYVKWLTEESNFSYDQGGIPICVGNEYPDVLAAFDGVELVVDNPAPEGEEDLFGEINTESEISLNADNTHVQDVLEHALNGDKTMEEIADEWNQAWTDAQEEYDITPAPYVYGSGVAAE